MISIQNNKTNLAYMFGLSDDFSINYGQNKIIRELIDFPECLTNDYIFFFNDEITFKVFDLLMTRDGRLYTE